MRSSNLQRGSKLRIRIDRLSVGGRGVARAEDLVIFVPDVCANEEVEVEITSLKKNFAEAKLIEVVKPSPDRIVPPCPVAGICGGCNWQHIKYTEQLVWKRELVRESLRKFSGFDVSSDDAVQPVIPSPRLLRYRNRVQFHHAPGTLGYFRRGSHQLIAIDDCPIAEEPIAQEIPELRESLANEPAGRIEVFVAEDESVHTRGGGLPGDEEEGGLNFAFSQVNTQQNRNLVSIVVSVFMAKLMEIEAPIVDLYAGSGNFTFPLAKAFPHLSVTGVELNRESVERAVEKNRLGNHDIRWVQGDVGAYLAAHPLPAGAAVLLDPPRSGCEPAVVSALASANASFVVYVSCHPVTLARDLKVFRNSGWTLERVQPFDMFPQTDHIETLVVLTRPTSV